MYEGEVLRDECLTGRPLWRVRAHGNRIRLEVQVSWEAPDGIKRQGQQEQQEGSGSESQGEAEGQEGEEGEEGHAEPLKSLCRT